MAGILPTPLTPLEEYLLRDDRPGYRMTFLIEQRFDGEINREGFDVGIAEASLRHPLLNALVRRRRFWGWQWISAEGNLQPVDWDDIDRPIEFRADQRIDLFSEVGVRFHARVGRGQSLLVTEFHHACCDGMGAIQFLSDLFAAYTRHIIPQSQNLPGFQPVQETHLLRRADLAVHHDKTMPWIRLFFRTLAYAWHYSVHAPSPLSRKRLASTDDAPLQFPATLTRTLSPNVQRSLRQVARRHNVTVNDLLIRELLLLIRDWNRRNSSINEKDEISILVPTDQRNIDHDGVPAANIMGFVAFQRRVDELSAPETLLASINQESRFYKRWRFGVAFLDGLKVVRWIPGALQFLLNRHQCYSTAVLSCIGDPSLAITANFPVNHNGDPVFGNLALTDLNSAPPIRPLTHAAFTTWHFANKMRLGLRCDPAIFTQESAQELLDEFANRVIALSETALEIHQQSRAA